MVRTLRGWQQKMFLLSSPPWVLQFICISFGVLQCPRLPKNYGRSLERKYKTEDAGTKNFEAGGIISERRWSVDDLVVSLTLLRGQKVAQKDTYAPDSARLIWLNYAGSSSKVPGDLYNCDNQGHVLLLHELAKAGEIHVQGNMVDENVDMIEMVSNVCAMISEVNLVGDVILKMTSEKELKLTNVL
ncbi:hypothetical protein Tco_1475174 [Tanacetum coccineum]